MALNENLTTFAGRRVEDWNAEVGIEDPAKIAYRVRASYEEVEEGTSLAAKLGELLDDPDAKEVEALVIGAWNAADSGESSQEVAEALASGRDKLRSLRYLFFGDIISEECEISWIVQSDLSPVLEAYPNLEHLSVRGGTSLSLGVPRHEKLRELVIQAGGLPTNVIHEVASSELPSLEHLELWLGTPQYQGNATVEDLAPLLTGNRFPRLRYLGLRNSEIADEIAGVVALAPVTGQLEVLDLSLGTLSDAGAKALLGSPAVRRLKKLDIHHHFVSEEMLKELKALGPEVDDSDPQEPHEWRGEFSRFVSVSE